MTDDDDKERFPFGRPVEPDPVEAQAAAELEAAEERDYQRTRADQLRRAQQHTKVGAIVLAVGVAVTVGSYIAAGPGGAYVATVGAILFGLFTLMRGLMVRSDLTRR